MGELSVFIRHSEDWGDMAVGSISTSFEHHWEHGMSGGQVPFDAVVRTTDAIFERWLEERGRIRAEVGAKAATLLQFTADRMDMVSVFTLDGKPVGSILTQFEDTWEHGMSGGKVPFDSIVRIPGPDYDVWESENDRYKVEMNNPDATLTIEEALARRARADAATESN